MQEEHWKLESIEIAPIPTVQSVLAEMQKEESIISEVSEEVCSHQRVDCCSLVQYLDKLIAANHCDSAVYMYF